MKVSITSTKEYKVGTTVKEKRKLFFDLVNNIQDDIKIDFSEINDINEAVVIIFLSTIANQYRKTIEKSGSDVELTSYNYGRFVEAVLEYSENNKNEYIETALLYVITKLDNIDFFLDLPSGKFLVENFEETCFYYASTFDLENEFMALLRIPSLALFYTKTDAVVNFGNTEVRGEVLTNIKNFLKLDLKILEIEESIKLIEHDSIVYGRVNRIENYGMQTFIYDLNYKIGFLHISDVSRYEYVPPEYLKDTFVQNQILRFKVKRIKEGNALDLILF